MLGVAGGVAAQAPLTIGAPGFGPFWVDVRVAFDPDGDPNAGYFAEGPSWAQDQIRTSGGDRVEIGLDNVDYIDARLCDDLDCAIRSAELIVHGTVVGRTFGFFGGDPGQLLEIAPGEVLKGAWGKQPLLAFYPVATFCAGGKTVVKTDDRWPAPPAVGDGVFLFSGWKPWENGLVQIEYEGDIMPIAADGTFYFGAFSRMQNVPEPRSARALEDRIRVILRSREQKLKNAQSPDGMPYVLYGSGGIEPEWVDARVALGDDGRLDRTLFPERLGIAAEGGISASSVPGSTFRIGPRDPDPAFIKPEATLGQAADQASLVALARITNRAFGFWRGIAGQLLRLAIERTFRGVPTLDKAYLFLPQGDFELGPFRIVKTDARYPDPPDIGAEVFLFTYPEIHDYLFFPLEGRGLVPVDSDGLLVLGSDYRRAEDASDRPLRTKEDLIERIQEGSSRAADSDSVTR